MATARKPTVAKKPRTRVADGGAGPKARVDTAKSGEQRFEHLKGKVVWFDNTNGRGRVTLSQPGASPDPHAPTGATFDLQDVDLPSDDYFPLFIGTPIDVDVTVQGDTVKVVRMVPIAETYQSLA